MELFSPASHLALCRSGDARYGYAREGAFLSRHVSSRQFVTTFGRDREAGEEGDSSRDEEN